MAIENNGPTEKDESNIAANPVNLEKDPAILEYRNRHRKAYLSRISDVTDSKITEHLVSERSILPKEGPKETGQLPIEDQMKLDQTESTEFGQEKFDAIFDPDEYASILEAQRLMKEDQEFFDNVRPPDTCYEERLIPLSSESPATRMLFGNNFLNPISSLITDAFTADTDTKPKPADDECSNRYITKKTVAGPMERDENDNASIHPSIKEENNDRITGTTKKPIKIEDREDLFAINLKKRQMKQTSRNKEKIIDLTNLEVNSESISDKQLFKSTFKKKTDFERLPYISKEPEILESSEHSSENNRFIEINGMNSRSCNKTPINNTFQKTTSKKQVNIMNISDSRFSYSTNNLIELGRFQKKTAFDYRSTKQIEESNPIPFFHKFQPNPFLYEKLRPPDYNQLRNNSSTSNYPNSYRNSYNESPVNYHFEKSTQSFNKRNGCNENLISSDVPKNYFFPFSKFQSSENLQSTNVSDNVSDRVIRNRGTMNSAINPPFKTYENVQANHSKNVSFFPRTTSFPHSYLSSRTTIPRPIPSGDSVRPSKLIERNIYENSSHSNTSHNSEQLYRNSPVRASSNLNPQFQASTTSSHPDLDCEDPLVQAAIAQSLKDM